MIYVDTISKKSELFGNLLDVWTLEALPIYGNPRCPNCGEVIVNDIIMPMTNRCSLCKRPFHEDDVVEIEAFEVNEQEIHASQDTHFSVDPYRNDIVIYRSAYYRLIGDRKVFCFGHKWFDGEEAPYTVYSVRTDKEVEA
jgi:hypothetical protein